MSTGFPLHRYTYQEYVWLEQESTTRHEFLDGEIFAMAGGTPEHAAMAAEVIRQLGDQLSGGPCRVFTSDLGVRVMATGLATYPDASVVCGPTERDPEKKTNVLNPKVLVEITSDGTEDYDRGEKLENYRRIPSLGNVVVISHREPRADVWFRASEAEPWSHTEIASGRVELAAIQCALDVDAVWRAAREPA